MPDDLPDPQAPPVLVDGNNVMGSVPDGWWRDRPGAVRRLVARLTCYHRKTGIPVLVVLDVVHSDFPEGTHEGIEVRYPSRAGRNAADGKIIELLDEDRRRPIEVITSDRALADSAARRDATVVGARTFLARLDVTGC